MAKIDFSIYESMARVLKASGQLEQLTESFCENNSKRIDELKRAVANKNAIKAGEIAHALKGSCSMFGAKSCAELCQKIEYSLEEICGSNDYSELSNLIPLLQSELANVIEFLRAQSNHQKPECCP